MNNHTVQLNEDMDRKVKKEAKKLSLTFVGFIRMALKEYFQNRETKMSQVPK